MAVFPWGHGKFAVDEPVLFIAFLTVTAGEAERIGFQPLLFGKLHVKGSLSGNHNGACHPEAIAFHPEGVISHGQIQPAVTVVGPHLAVGIFGSDGDAGEIGGRINPVSVVEGDSMLFTNQELFIFPDGGVQVVGQGSGVIRTASCKIHLCRIVFCLGGFADIILFFQIVCHRRHQLEQTNTGLAVRRRPLAETEMSHRCSRNRKVITAILITAGKVSCNAINRSDLSLVHTSESMTAVFQRLTQGLSLGVGNVFRGHHQLAASFYHQHKLPCLLCRLRIG